MSQEIIFNFLNNNKNKWFTAREISNFITNISLGSISSNLKKLRISKFIDYRINGLRTVEYKYKK